MFTRVRWLLQTYVANEISIILPYCISIAILDAEAKVENELKF